MNLNLFIGSVVSCLWGISLTYFASYLLKEYNQLPKIPLPIYVLNALSAACILPSLYYIYWPNFFWSYLLCASALLMVITTDLHVMLISRFVTLYLIPLGFLFSWLTFLPIYLGESLFGALSAYFFLRSVDFIYLKLTSKQGMGSGDAELLAFIGAFLGPFGWWFSLIIGSCLGSLIGIWYVWWHQLSWYTTRLPFGPFLAYGALCFMLGQHFIYTSLFKIFISLN